MFSERLEGWAKQQPEWPSILMGSRAERRRMARLIGRVITTIPAVTHAQEVLVGPDATGKFETVPMNRALRRRAGRKAA
jgi:hypothetical protein